MLLAALALTLWANDQLPSLPHQSQGSDATTTHAAGNEEHRELYHPPGVTGCFPPSAPSFGTSPVPRPTGIQLAPRPCIVGTISNCWCLCHRSQGDRPVSLYPQNERSENTTPRACPPPRPPTRPPTLKPASPQVSIPTYLPTPGLSDEMPTDEMAKIVYAESVEICKKETSAYLWLPILHLLQILEAIQSPCLQRGFLV